MIDQPAPASTRITVAVPGMPPECRWDIDITAGTIRLHKTYEWSPKASEGAIPLSAKLAEVLSERKRRFGERSSFVFPSPDGGKCRLHLLDQLRALCRKAEIAEPLPRIHDLRHTFAATLRRKGVPLEAISGIMRHAELKMTLIYAPYHESEGRSAVAELDKLF